MTPCIQLLSEHTINLIAAGEVIADPSSVVKELVENALDAGSLDIHVEIFSGGRSLIRVTDDGCGMGPEDATLCFQRYATSKLRDVQDLYALHTMGFRGEALSSIASIAKCTLITATENAGGTCVEIEGGVITAAKPAVRARGTTFEIRDLFYNVPVRRTFQKSPHTDALAIYRVMLQLSLAYPQVRFCLMSDQKEMLLAPAVTNVSPLEALKERMQTVLGEEFEQMRPIEKSGSLGQIRGFLSTPNRSKQTRSSQYFLFNQRAVTSNPLAMAVREGYGTALQQGRFPLFVLHLNVPQDSIDVNVHPQKKEMRLRHETKISRWLTEAVTEALYGAAPAYTPIEWPQTSIEQSIAPFICAEETPIYKQDSFAFDKWPIEPKQKQVEEQLFFALPTPKLPPRVLATVPGYLMLDPQGSHFADKPLGMWLLDQRAAHRRVLNDQLAGTEKPLARESQMLLVPVIVPLSPLQQQLFQAASTYFTNSGWHIEPFGPSSIAINGVPHASLGLSYDTLFLSLLEGAQEKEFASLKEPASRFACALARRCISMHKQLTREEAASLVEALFKCQEPYNCPLGHPTLLCVNTEQISSLFKGAS